MKHNYLTIRTCSLISLLSLCAISSAEVTGIKKEQSKIILNISPLKNKEELNTDVKIKSYLLNETDKKITLKYNFCTYKYDSSLKIRFDYNCIGHNTILDKEESIDFDLQPALISWPYLYNISSVYIIQISDGNIEQNFLSSKIDEEDFEKLYEKTKNYGIHKRAFSCSLLKDQELTIFSTDNGFLCY